MSEEKEKTEQSKENTEQPKEKIEQPADQPKLSSDEKMWAMFCHLSALAGFIIPFGNIIAPLIIWVIKKEEYPLVNDQGKEAVNFQISMTIYFIASIIMIFIVIGIPLLILLGLFELIVIVIASIKANEGVKYRYPFTIRFID